MTDSLATSPGSLASEGDAHVEHGHDDHAHPTEKQYWWIFIILAVVTAIEVAWSYMGLSGPSLVLPLVGMMILKFILIAAVFMHLLFDSKIKNGRVYYLCFGAGLVLTMAVFAIVFASFEFQI